MTQRQHEKPPVWTTRRAYSVLAFGFILFALYGSLLPFELQPISPAAAWIEFQSAAISLPTGRISRSDVLANILLFVPVGFALAGVALADRWSYRWLAVAAPLVVAFSGAVSITAEFLQVFFSERVSSGLDIAAQTVGTICGITLWVVTGPALTQWLRETAGSVRHDRASRLLTAYTAAWLFVSLAPFNITVDLGDLAERVRDGRISLLGVSDGVSRIRFALDAIAETCSAIPLGGWAHAIALSNGVPQLAWPIGIFLILVVEGLQVFIESHSASGLDMGLGVVGVAVGIGISRRLLAASARAVEPSDRRSTLLFSATLLAMAALNCLYYWQPYDFIVDNELIRDKLSRVSLLPFAMFLTGSYLSGLNNLLTSLALSVPLGLAAHMLLRTTPVPPSFTFAVVGIGATGLYTAIECGQFFLPTRTPDPTDVLIGSIGAIAGAFVGRWLLGSSREKRIDRGE